MRTKALLLKSRLLGSGGTASGALGGIGSIHNVCHSLCVTIVSILAIFGITTSILPLMFLQTYQMYFWAMALVFTLASFYFYQRQGRKSARDRNLLFINTGLLIFGLPISQVNIFSFLVDYMDFLRFVGGSLAVMGLFLLLFGKKLQSIVFSPEELEKVSLVSSVQNLNSNKVITPTFSIVQLPKLSVSSMLFVLIIGSFLVNQYLMFKMNILGSVTSQMATPLKQVTTTMSNMKLTPFDVVLAKERMDKNNDGICDVCGMSIDQCISSGQVDCNMGNNPQAIGVLGTQHIHADFKVYVDSQPLDFAKPEYYMKSSFIHVDNIQNRDDASSVLHMHATKVPLNIFFRSLGMKLEKDSLSLTDGQILKNENGNMLKFYLNGQKVDELGNYVFQPLDKLLISYGLENDSDIQKQINSVTNFAKDHQK